jgi:hypothetical protein
VIDEMCRLRECPANARTAYWAMLRTRSRSPITNCSTSGWRVRTTVAISGFAARLGDDLARLSALGAVTTSRRALGGLGLGLALGR